MRFRAELIKINGKPNKNGRIYTKQTIKEIKKNILKYNSVYIVINDFHDFYSIGAAFIIGKITKVKEKIGWFKRTLIVEGELNNSEFANAIISEAQKGVEIYLSPNGTGTYKDDNKTIIDYKYDSCSIITEPAFDVKPIELIEELNATN